MSITGLNVSISIEFQFEGLSLKLKWVKINNLEKLLSQRLTQFHYYIAFSAKHNITGPNI